MSEYQMPVRAIKRILKEELEKHKNGFYNAYPQFIMSDVQKEMVSKSYYYLLDNLEECQSYEDLNNYISDAGYRMSLTDWINSL